MLVFYVFFKWLHCETRKRILLVHNLVFIYTLCYALILWSLMWRLFISYYFYLMALSTAWFHLVLIQNLSFFIDFATLCTNSKNRSSVPKSQTTSISNFTSVKLELTVLMRSGWPMQWLLAEPNMWKRLTDDWLNIFFVEFTKNVL